jgi:acetyl-CoA C-acetyltransferase
MAATRVALVSAGMSRFGMHAGATSGLFASAFERALATFPSDLEDNEASRAAAYDLVRRELGEAFVGSLAFGGAQLGNPAALYLEHMGLAGVPARRVENACASGGFALRDAVAAVASGRTRLAMAAGIERMNDVPDLHKRYWLGVSGDTEWERLAGLTFPGVYALMADRHMHEFGTTREELAAVAVKNHANGAMNPQAQFQKETTLEKVLAAPMVCDPLGLFDCCGTTDGAAVVFVAAESLARELVERPIWIAGSGAATDALAIHDRASMTEIPATGRALERALVDAGRAGFDITPADIDVAELHDCFTIAEILAVEDLGFAEKGAGGAYVRSGATARTSGAGPAVNSSGGLKAKGHPLGATGVAQAVEVFHQLSHSAGKRQVPDARVGLTHNVGGSGATCAVHLFARDGEAEA